MMKIAMIGCGAIGASVLALLQGHAQVEVAWVVVPRVTPEIEETVKRFASQAQVVTALQSHMQVDLVVECAGHTAIEQHVLPALQRGTAAVVASIGALSAPGMAEKIEAAAQQGATQVHLLSGAIGGIDALSAARVGGLDAVVYTGRKPPMAWTGTPAQQLCDLASLKEAFCIFEGTAREAAQLYPKNANVAATLSLAGLGLDHTTVRLFADPAVQENVHHVEARGAFGSMELTMRGKPLAANPKTSALTVYSVVRAVLNRAACVAI
jgi:aspartate dehydrogenase